MSAMTDKNAYLVDSDVEPPPTAVVVDKNRTSTYYVVLVHGSLSIVFFVESSTTFSSGL